MDRPLVGVLWGDFPWDAPVRKFGKLLSWGSVARTFTRALGSLGTVVPCRLSPNGTTEERERELAAFLTSIDILWADFYPATVPALRLRAQLDLPCPAMLVAGGTLPKGAEAILFPALHLLRSDDALLFSCRADREIWHELVQWSTVREYIVPCIVDLEAFHPGGVEEKIATRKRYGLPPESPLLLSVGRRNIQKNLHTLLRLFAAVRERVPDAHLCCVGEEDDIQLAEFGVRNTGYGRWLRSLAAELRIADHLTLLDSVFGDALARLYRASDVAVNLSVYHRENFGLSQAEAQLSGIPTVCSDWGGFKDVVRHGETGYLLETVITKHGVRVNWRAGVDQVVALLGAADKRAAMGARATAWAQQEFTLAPVTEQLHAVIGDIWPAGSSSSTGEPAYEPSEFACRFEEHKRLTGWYAGATGETARSHWYPPMFQGGEYALYETLMRPYATRLAQDLDPAEIGPGWIPYSTSGHELDRIRHIVRDPDPIWPHNHHCDGLEWEVCTRINGIHSIAEIARSLGERDLIAILWRLSVEGFILFYVPPDEETARNEGERSLAHRHPELSPPPSPRRRTRSRAALME